MNIIVNGRQRQMPPETTVAELLEQMQLDARHVAVEVNLDVVPRAEHAERVLCEGDRLEVVTLVGGG